MGAICSLKESLWEAEAPARGVAAIAGGLELGSCAGRRVMASRQIAPMAKDSNIRRDQPEQETDLWLLDMDSTLY